MKTPAPIRRARARFNVTVEEYLARYRTRQSLTGCLCPPLGRASSFAFHDVAAVHQKESRPS